MAEKNLEEMREAVEAIREKMAAAAREAGRDPAEVQLCAACKTRTADTVAASAALAIDVFGENHVQELCTNYDAGAYCGKPSHFIGHLQTNKIKKVLGRASLIQSVDSEHLLAAIEKEAAKAGIVQDVLLEVNIGGEESKSGVSPEQLWPLLDLSLIHIFPAAEPEPVGTLIQTGQLLWPCLLYTSHLLKIWGGGYNLKKCALHKKSAKSTRKCRKRKETSTRRKTDAFRRAAALMSALSITVSLACLLYTSTT